MIVKNNKNLVSYELALLAKEIGYNIESKYIYNLNTTELISKYNLEFYQNLEDFIIAPNIYDLQQYLRDQYTINIVIYSKSQESWMYRILVKNQNLEDGIYEEDFDTYNDALNNAIEQCLVFIKETISNLNISVSTEIKTLHDTIMKHVLEYNGDKIVYSEEDIENLIFSFTACLVNVGLKNKTIKLNDGKYLSNELKKVVNKFIGNK